MKRKNNNPNVPCRYHSWRLRQRGGIWVADGRGNEHDLGRHSLGTRDRDEALQLVHDLDLKIAVDRGLAPAAALAAKKSNSLTFARGRELYEDKLQLPKVIGGVKDSTQKRYRATLDKLVPFLERRGLSGWHELDKRSIEAYGAYLEKEGYALGTIRRETVTVLQAFRWLILEEHLTGVEPIRMRLPKVEEERAYCYTAAEVAAIIEHCRADESLHWLADVVTALAYSGLRISELASLRWSDLDLDGGMLRLTDESGHRERAGKINRTVKSSRSRSLPIHTELRQVLGRLPRVDAHPFHGPRSGPLKPDTVRNVLIRKVLTPLAAKFPSPPGERGFRDGRLHSFRHFFASACANAGLPERMVMEWLGHQDSAMVRHYYPLHDAESRRKIEQLPTLGAAGTQPTGHTHRAATTTQEEPPTPERPGATAP